MKQKTIIGLVGEQAGGKGTAADIIIKKYGGTRLTTSNILRRTLDSLHVPSSRESLTTLALSIKDGFGEPILMNAMLRDVEGVNSDLIIVDGIRMPGDTEPFKEEYGKNFHLIYVTADQKLRYERSKTRGEKAGESEATFEQFAEKERARTESKIAEVGAQADFKIENNTNAEELEEKVIKVMEQI